MLKAPCKDCVDRQIGCHATCEKYIAYDNERKEIQNMKLKERQSEFDWYKIRRHHQRKDYR